MGKSTYIRHLDPTKPLPKHWHTRVCRLEQKQNEEWENANRFRYPEQSTIPVHEILDACEACDSLWLPQHPARFAFDAALGFNAKKGKKGKGKGKGKKGGPKTPKWPDANAVWKEVVKMFSGMPVAGNEGNIVVMEQNCEFLNLSKAKYFEKSFVEVFQRCHIAFLSEVDGPGVDHLAKALNYTGYTSKVNSRGQGVAFLVHPRLKVINGPIAYNSVANVQNIPDLRPGWRIDVEDTVTGEKFAVIVLHLKSMLGGPQVTAVVRYQQNQALVNDIAADLKKIDNGAADAIGFIVGGDMNFKLNTKFNDADPLYNAGFQLLERWDNQGTQVMNNSRIDGLFYKGLKSKLTWYDVTPFFKNKVLGRSFTDHANLKAELCTVSKDNTSKKDDTATIDGSTGASSEDATAKSTAAETLPEIKLWSHPSAVKAKGK